MRRERPPQFRERRADPLVHERLSWLRHRPASPSYLISTLHYATAIGKHPWPKMLYHQWKRAASPELLTPATEPCPLAVMYCKYRYNG